MWDKVKLVIITALCTLGVLFIILMLWPEGEDETVTEETVAVEEEEEETEDEEDTEEIEDTDDEEEPEEDSDEEDVDGEENSTGANVDIPDSVLSKGTISFRTTTLDNKAVSESVFSDYDITIVHVWGTFCDPCIAEMPNYAKTYKELPDNVNLVGIICDVYDGIDSNVSDANDILDEAGAKFMNLRTSDDIYDIIAGIQFVPSSFLVDREGHVIGEILDGADYSDTMRELAKYVD